ncbi:MAG: hypothetical protein A2W91_15570 [Bacteroidetes bacterium GWF2_38_335]|nr:MAG: hypothetical protein A2W91_15570 [Bacteroidetes bacterium GWF2_38_335]OFY81512.1 MAG: hypothetical protein A2281_11430 [Bacteroidetes bacterium RIFOXYA12_FULL_38_20]HBS87681.1 hypothetical protein [Bacteroidales bacterium]
MELNIDFFKIDQKRKPAKGKILISEPYLGDQFFERSVIYLVEHNEKGSVGYVLNKPTKLIVDEVIDDFPSFRSQLSLGGPVSPNTLHYIHTLGSLLPECEEIQKGLYWGGNFEELKFLIKRKAVNIDQIRFFIGYSGWSVGQLERELTENSWLVGELENSMILKNFDEELWKKTLQNFDHKYKLWANFPENPGMN